MVFLLPLAKLHLQQRTQSSFGRNCKINRELHIIKAIQIRQNRILREQYTTKKETKGQNDQRGLHSLTGGTIVKIYNKLSHVLILRLTLPHSLSRQQEVFISMWTQIEQNLCFNLVASFWNQSISSYTLVAISHLLKAISMYRKDTDCYLQVNNHLEIWSLWYNNIRILPTCSHLSTSVCLHHMD